MYCGVEASTNSSGNGFGELKDCETGSRSFSCTSRSRTVPTCEIYASSTVVIVEVYVLKRRKRRGWCKEGSRNREKGG